MNRIYNLTFCKEFVETLQDLEASLESLGFERHGFLAHKTKTGISEEGPYSAVYCMNENDRTELGIHNDVTPTAHILARPFVRDGKRDDLGVLYMFNCNETIFERIQHLTNDSLAAHF